MRKLLASLSGLFASLISSGVALAAAESAATAGDSQARAAIGIAAGLAVAIAAFGAALGQGRTGAAAMESIGRNPNAADRLFLAAGTDPRAVGSSRTLWLRHRYYLDRQALTL